MTRLPAVHLFYRRGTSTQGRRGHPMAMLLCSLDETRPLEIITKNNNDASTQLAPTRLIAFAMYFFQSFQSKTRKQPSNKHKKRTLFTLIHVQFNCVTRWSSIVCVFRKIGSGSNSLQGNAMTKAVLKQSWFGAHGCPLLRLGRLIAHPGF